MSLPAVDSHEFVLGLTRQLLPIYNVEPSFPRGFRTPDIPLSPYIPNSPKISIECIPKTNLTILSPQNNQPFPMHRAREF